MVRAMGGVNLIDKKNTDELINMLGLRGTGNSGKSKQGAMVRTCFEDR